MKLASCKYYFVTKGDILIEIISFFIKKFEFWNIINSILYYIVRH